MGLAAFPVNATNQNLRKGSPCAEYDYYTYDSCKVVIRAYFSPTLNFHNAVEGLQFTISIDDEEPQIISLNKEGDNDGIRNSWLAGNIIFKK